MRTAIKTLPPQPRRSKRPKGWTRERRAQQAIIIHNWKPWTLASGPKTAPGKAISSKNAVLHGACGRGMRDEASRVRAALRRCREVNTLVRGLCRALRDEARATAKNLPHSRPVTTETNLWSKAV